MIWFHLHMESNEQNKLTKQKQTNGYREQADSYQSEEGWGLGESGERIKQRKQRLMDTDKVW